MNNTDANRITPGYELKDELARFCLPPANRDPNRKLAWTNSICILFLLVGLLGAKRAANFVAPPPQTAEVIPIIIEAATPPPAASENQNQVQKEQDQPDEPQVVAVILDSPAINFSVPTVGNLVVPTALAKAPPAVALKPAVARALAINSTGIGGERPQPPYPKIALEQAQQGSVVLTMTADETGVITSVAVKESSGYPILDRSTLDFVKRHWTVPPGGGTRIYEATITYKLTVN